MANSNNKDKTTQGSKIRKVWIDDLKVNPVTQREFKPAWANEILRDFDPIKYQRPHVSKRADGTLYIVEGQHGTWAKRQYVGENHQIEVELYEGLTEEQEADLFLSLNNKKSVDIMSRFKVGVTAGREIECDIDRIVRANGCNVNVSQGANNAIAAVGTLTTIYTKFGPQVLGETLRIIGDSFAEGGYERPILIGISQVLARFPDADRVRLVTRLSGLRNGWNGVIQKMTTIRTATGCNVQDGAAAAVVEIYNTGRGGKKLPNWFRDDIAA